MTDKDKKKISDSIQLLSSAFNKEDSQEPVLKAIDLLHSLNLTDVKLEPIRADKITKEDAPFIPTGIDWMDGWLSGGIRKPELVMFGAVPFGGKTHFQAWFTGNLLLTHTDAQAAHFIGEDIITDVRNMYKRILPVSAMKRLWLVDMADYRFGVREIEQGVRKLRKMGAEIDIIVADHVDVMTPTHFAFSEQGGLSSIVRDLRIMTKRLDVVGVTASQSHEKSSERKGMARLFGAKVGKSGNADIIMMIEGTYGQTLKITLDKARGRKMPDNASKQVVIDWSRMEVKEI